jgi:DNA-binding SARP family transcriptional activator
MLELRICGGVEVAVDGHAVPESLIGGRQGRLVLAYLACERNRPVRREELADLLWPGQLPESWTTSLSAVISRLRRLFAEVGLDGPAVIASMPGAYQLDLPAGSRVDLEELTAAVAEGEAAVARGEVDTALAATQRADAIAGRGFLADDCEWVDTRRDVIRDLRVRALIARSAAHLVAGESRRAIEDARLAVELDDSREAAYRHLMLALAAAGERAEALRVWDRCRVTLVDELGIDPSPETEAVYLRLLDADSQAPTPSPLPSGVVTFLLTDIVGSSGLWEDDAAAMAAALERHDAIIGEVVSAHGGTLLKSKLEGDATVSVFARTTECAVAALDLLDALESEPWPEGAHPRLRMAMHTGEAFERGGDYFGPALNRAARLRSLASANEILLSQAAAELVRDHLPSDIVLRDRGLQSLRGLSRSENVFELTRTTSHLRADEPSSKSAAALDRPPVPAALSGSGPFVGRGNELDQLDKLWQGIVDGKSAAAFIGGEPGVGKSRLAGEIAQRAYANGALVLYGRCDEDLAAPLHPFLEAVRVLAPALGADRLGAIRGVGELTRVVPEMIDMLGEKPAVWADPDTERLALFDAVTQLFASASNEAPLLVVLDDLHWAGKSTLSLLRHLLSGTTGSRLLVVGTYRDTELARTHPFAETLADLRRDNEIYRLTLSGLAEADVTAYLAAIGNTDRAFGRELSEITAGNPFFMIEVVRHVEDSGGSWQPGSLPEGVREATGRRLSRLSEEANRALAAAAVVGTTFDLAIVEELQDTDLVDTIAEAVQAGLVFEEPGSLVRFRFAHAIVRQVLLAELVSLKRVRLHRSIAQLLEAAPDTGDPDERLADLAYHWFECAAAGSADKAVAACRRAADRAMERLAYEEAGDLYGMALQALEWIDDADAETTGSLHLTRCDALLTAGDVAGARRAIDALELAAAGSERLAAWYTTYEGLLAVLSEPDRLNEIVQSIGAAAGAMRAVGDPLGEAKARYVHAMALECLGQLGAAERALDAALAAARSAGDQRLANAVLAEAPPAALWGPSPVTRASGRCLDVVRVLRIASSTPAVEAVALRCQAVLEALRGRMEPSRRMISSARRTVEQLGLTHRRLETELSAGLIELLDGKAALAEEMLRTAYEGLRERGIGGEAALAAAFLGRALLIQARVDEADAVAAEAEALAGSDLKAAITWRDVRAEVALRRGDGVRALSLAREAVELASATDALLLVADARLTLSRVLSASGDAAGAETEARRAVEACEAKGATVFAALAREAMGRATGPKIELSAAAAAAEAAGWGRAFANEATRTRERADIAMDERNWERVLACHADDYRLEERRSVAKMSLDRASAIDTLRWVFEGGGNVQTEILATRGGKLFLAQTTWQVPTPEATVVVLTMSSVDDEGRYTQTTTFDSDDLDDAFAELDRMFLEGEGADHADVIRLGNALLDGLARRDTSALRGLLAPGFRADYISAGQHDLTASEWLASLEDASYVLGWEGARAQHVTRLSSLGGLWAIGVVGPAGAQRLEPRSLMVLQVTDGQVSGLNFYDATDVEAACAALESRTSSDSEPFENDATATLRRMEAAYASHNWEALIETLGEGWHIEDRRRVVGGILDRDQSLASNRLVFDGGGSVTLDSIFATRGRFLALGRMTLHLPALGAGDTVLALAPVNDAGVAAYTLMFDPDDIDGAIAEIDRLFLEGEGAEHVDVLRTVTSLLDALAAGDNSRAAALLAPGMVVQTHGEVALSDATRVGRQSDIPSALDVLFHSNARVEHIARLTSQGGLWAVAIPGDQDIRDVRLTLAVRVADSQISRIDIYAERDTHAASASFDDSPVGNMAWRAQLRFADANDNHNFQAIVDAADPHIVYTDHRRGVRLRLEAEQALELFRAGSSVINYLQQDRTLLKTRGDRLSLGRLQARFAVADAGPSVVELLSLAECGPDGRIRGLTSFDPEDIAAAYAALDARHAEMVAEDRCSDVSGNSAWQAALRFQEALNSRDWEAVSQAVDPDVVLIDHRRTAQMRLKGADALADFRVAISINDFRQDCTLLATRADRLALSRLHARFLVADAGPSEIELLSLTECGADGRVGAYSVFSPEASDAAYAALEARYAEMVAEDRASVVSGNSAWRAALRFQGALNTRDWPAFLDVIAPGFVQLDHRQAVQMRTEGDDALDLYRLAVSIDEFEMDRALLATRGDRLALIREHASFLVNDAGPSELDMVSLVECRLDGRVSSVINFNPDDIDSANAALEARYAEMVAEDLASDLSGNPAWRAQLRFSDAQDRRDWKGVLAAVDPRLVYIDERQGVRLRLEGEQAFDVLRFGASIKSLQQDLTLLATRGDHLAVSRLHARFLVVDAGPSEIEVLSLAECGADGRLRTITAFNPEEIDVAYAALDARYAELCAEEAGLALGNEAWRAALRFTDAENRRDWAGLLETLAPGFTFADNRQGVRLDLKGQDAIEAQRVVFSLREFAGERELVGIRGDRLALTRDLTRFLVADLGPSELDILSLVECGNDGRICSLTAFSPDDVQVAYAALETRHAELCAEEPGQTLGNDAWRAWLRFCDAENRRDWQGFLEVLDPEFIFVDDRQGVRLRLEGEEALATYRNAFTIEEFQTSCTLLATRGERLALGRGHIRFVAGDAGSSEMEYVSLTECGIDGRIHMSTGFDPSEIEAAYAALNARYAELCAEETGHLLDNEAWRAWLRFCNAENRRDWQGFLEVLDPEFIFVDNRQGVRLRLEGEEALAAHRNAFTIEEFQTSCTLLATRGEHLALGRGHVRFVAGDAGQSEMDFLSLTECGIDGRIRMSTGFDPREIEAAYAALDARYAELNAEQQQRNRAWESVQKWKDAIDRRDRQQWEGLFHPEFLFDDRRTGLELQLGVQEAIESLGVMFDMEVAEWRCEFVAAAGDRVVLIVSSARGATRSVSEFEASALNVIEIAEDGRIMRQVCFDLGLLDVAASEMNARAAAANGDKG